MQLRPIAGGDSVLDLIVIGCGPAGLSLAAESAGRGLTVGLIGPDLPFTNNYGVWEDEFKGNNTSTIGVQIIIYLAYLSYVFIFLARIARLFLG